MIRIKYCIDISNGCNKWFQLDKPYTFIKSNYGWFVELDDKCESLQNIMYELMSITSFENFEESDFVRTYNKHFITQKEYNRRNPLHEELKK